MGGATLSVVGTGFAEAERPVDGEADFAGVLVFLAIVLPPADRTKPQGARRRQRLIAAARTAITDFRQILHRA